MSAAEYNFCINTNCWTMSCNGIVTSLVDGYCASDANPANNFYFPHECCLSYSGGFLPLGSRTTAFISSQGGSAGANNWCSCCATGVNLWTHSFWKNVNKSSVGNMIGIAQNDAAAGETVCIASVGNIDKSSFTCTYLADRYNTSGMVPLSGGICCGNVTGWVSCWAGAKHTQGSGPLAPRYLTGRCEGTNGTCFQCHVWITPYYDVNEEKIVGKISRRNDTDGSF